MYLIFVAPLAYFAVCFQSLALCFRALRHLSLEVSTSGRFCRFRSSASWRSKAGLSSLNPPRHTVGPTARETCSETRSNSDCDDGREALNKEKTASHPRKANVNSRHGLKRSQKAIWWFACNSAVFPFQRRSPQQQPYIIKALNTNNRPSSRAVGRTARKCSCWCAISATAERCILMSVELVLSSCGCVPSPPCFRPTLTHAAPPSCTAAFHGTAPQQMLARPGRG
mmetsp:Transcript_7873/g.15650  ORF Transcript_7873/g.15650 Transcript_7873/m.15650 type:complete len:226 (+) Transcript_7873:639-1316(+)